MLLFILADIGGARSFSCNKSARADEGPRGSRDCDDTTA
jgi:hypothetical protein